MATYVTSDAHGHLRALDLALNLAQPGPHDTVYVLGDMVDRGPDPVGVMRLVSNLEGARALLGNHESMMLSSMLGPRAHGDEPWFADTDPFVWETNGGFTTLKGMEHLSAAERVGLLEWLRGLPLSYVAEVDDMLPSAGPGARRTFLLSHAGIDAAGLSCSLSRMGWALPEGTGAAGVPARALRDAVGEQSPDDLLWIRGEFWWEPTGLVGAEGAGPVVVSGHTPSILLGGYARRMRGTGSDDGMHGCVVEVGACQDTGGVADKVDIDCAAAAGWPSGRVGVMRLEDRRVWFADVERGE